MVQLQEFKRIIKLSLFSHSLSPFHHIPWYLSFPLYPFRYCNTTVFFFTISCYPRWCLNFPFTCSWYCLGFHVGPITELSKLAILTGAIIKGLRCWIMEAV